MKCLVTGGAGFIASHVVDKLIEKSNKVAVIDNLSTGKKANLNPKAIFYKKDIQSPDISKIFEKEKPDIVFHYAAQIDVRKSVEDPIESAKTNILGSLNILENCRKFGAKKIVFASTGGAIYGEANSIPTPESHLAQPISPYGIEKLTIEHYLNFYNKEYGLDYLVLRFANVYGPRQNSKGEAGVVAIFCDELLSNRKVTINGPGNQTRDFIFVEDVVAANILGIDRGGVFNIGTGIETDINTIFLELKRIFNSGINAAHGPEKRGEQERSCLDCKKAKKMLNWQSKVSIEDGLKRTVKWYENNN